MNQGKRITMASSSEIDIIVEHALEDEKALRLATKVGNSFGRLKERIVEAFLISLQTRVIHELGSGWEARLCSPRSALVKKGEIFTMFKPEWKNSAVGLHCDKEGPAMLNLFVRVDDWENRMGKATGAELKSRLDAGYAFGKPTPPKYPWWIYLEKPLIDWTTEENLVSLYKKGEMLDLIAPGLTQLARISETFIDQV